MKITVTIRAKAPLAHGAYSDLGAGNMTMLRREPVVGLPGAPLVPCLSGNALRGVLRRIVMRGLFAAAGISRHDWVAEGRAKQWDRLYAALANGGHLERPDARVDPDQIRALRADVPPLSVFGAALYRYMLPGRMRVGFCWPICDETVTAGLVGPRDVTVGAEDLVTETGLVRHVDREHQSPEASGVTPMPTTVECFATGTVLESTISTDGATDVEAACIAWGLDRITTLGAKSAAGLGDVEI